MANRVNWQEGFTAYQRYLASLIGIPLGLAVGFVAGKKPLYIGVALFVPLFASFFFTHVELTVLGLLILRSALDPLSEQGVTGAFAIGFSALTLFYLTVRLLSKQTVQIDAFACFFAGWVALQGLWVALLPLGALGFGSEHLPEAIREWVRVSSWLMAYILTLQLKGRLKPEQVVDRLLLALVIPIGTAFLQLLVPGHLLPAYFAVNINQDGFRINGTLGVANTFATFLTLFIGLTYWKLSHSQKRLPWMVLLFTLVFFLVSTKVLVGVAMLIVLVVVLIAPRLSFTSLLGGILLLILMLGLFASTDAGRERLVSISQTPLFNSDIDVSRAVLLASYDNNSFNWRVAQWTSLLTHWQRLPILGYGLQTTNALGPMFAWAHNDYIRVLVEEGIVGLLLYFSFWGVQLLRLLRLMRSTSTSKLQKSFCSVLVAVLLAVMTGMLTENVWSHTALFFYWFSLSAIVDWEWEKELAPPTPKASHFR